MKEMSAKGATEKVHDHQRGEDAHEEDSERQHQEQQVQDQEQYSVFTTTEKWCIVSMVACAAWFSTLTSFIYYPAIHELASTFSVSIDKINLTITSYMAVATIAPTLAGDAADILGRRPVYMISLGLYIVANFAIVLSNSYAALLGLRVLQALAISGAFWWCFSSSFYLLLTSFFPLVCFRLC